MKSIHPLTATVIIFIAVLLLGVIFWAHGESIKVGGPDQVQYDPEGNVYIHISGDLFKMSPDFRLLRSYSLKQLGVQDLVGDYAFFSNGDVLIRRGNYQPGPIESLFRYLRLPDKETPIQNIASEGLHRCSLETHSCELFGDAEAEVLDYKSAFHLSVDWETDTVYMSDTARHKLRKFNAKGKVLAVQDEGYKFPNHNMLHQGRLLVADTNHHSIQEALTDNDNFGKIESSHQVKFQPRWTFSFSPVLEQWWVNNMDHNMSHGSVFILNKDWSFDRELPLPDDADPIDFGVFKDRVIITDLSNARIYQFDFEGNSLDKDLPEAIHNKLNTLRQESTYYQNISLAGIIAFVLFIVVGLGIGIAQAFSWKEPEVEPSEEEQNIRADNPDIEWIRKDRKKEKLFKAIYILPVLGIGMALLILMLPDKGDASRQLPYVEVGLMAFIFSALPFFFRHVLAMQLGVLGDCLVIKSGKKIAAAKGKNIFYSDTHVLAGSLTIPLNRNNLLFHTQDVIQKVMPLLRDALYVSNSQMMIMSIRRHSPLNIALTIGFVTVVAVALILSVYW